MKEITSLEEATAAFLAYSPPGMKGKYTLERMVELMAFLGNPQEKVKVVHIAGTSGKTSTAYFIRALLEAAGKRTGLTVSPHIVAVNERLQIDGEPLNETSYLAYLNRFFALLQGTNIQPTYFELLIAFAYWVFAEEKLEYAVIETGLGGLLDGTNVVQRPDKVCVITDIGLDHTDILGETVEEIAAQKAGIIQHKNQVIMHAQSAEINAVFAARATEKQASLAYVKPQSQTVKTVSALQKRNWQLAFATFEYVRHRDALPVLSPDRVEWAALQTPPGRWEFYRYKDKTIILDGAHNPQKMELFARSLTQQGVKDAALMMNLMSAPEKKIQETVAIIAPFARHVIIPEFAAGQDLKSRHSVDGKELAALFVAEDVTAQLAGSVEAAVAMLLSRPEKTLIITGSLYLVSFARPYILKLKDEANE